MRLTQLCTYELTDKCNRSTEHRACPCGHPDRWANSVGRRPTTDNQVVEIADRMICGGFRGVFAFHNYSEPLLAWPRILKLIARIKEEHPVAQFLLWTNGDRLASIPREQIEGVFCKMMITNYAGRDLAFVEGLSPEIHHIPPNLDWRLNPPRTESSGTPRCLRPHLEITWDYFGNLRACCNDWKNEIQIGNIHDTPFDILWARWVQLRSAVASEPMGAMAPERCLTCGTRYVHLANYVPEVAADIAKHVDPEAVP